MEKPSIKLTVDAVVFRSSTDNQKQVLLVKRRNDPFKDQWAFPGGFGEPGETLEKAAIRELKEETGIKLTHMTQVQAFDDPDRDPRGRVITVAFYGELKDYL